MLIALAPLTFVTIRFAMLGEFEILDTDAALRREELHGPLSEEFAEYKLRMTLSINPRLLVVGSSRVMQFREFLFDGCASQGCFYNAGGVLPTVRTALEFFRQLPLDHAPELMLLGLDVWHFNPNYEANTHKAIDLVPSWPEQVRRAAGVVREFGPRMETDADLRSLTFGGRPAPPGYRGARAILYGEGFRSDGSYSYGSRFTAEVLGQSASERSADALHRIAGNCCRFERFSQADPVALAELNELLDEARRSGTRVIAFTLPFADDVLDAIERDPERNAGFADVDDRIAAELLRRDVPFLRFPRLRDAGCLATEMWDGSHPSEVCAARILGRLSAAVDMSRFVDPARLRVLVGGARSGLSLTGR